IALEGRSIIEYDPDYSPTVPAPSNAGSFIQHLGPGSGYAAFEFQFVRSGTDDPVTLRNLAVNAYDIDSASGLPLYEFVEFSGFSRSQRSEPSILEEYANPAVARTGFKPIDISQNSWEPGTINGDWY